MRHTLLITILGAVLAVGTTACRSGGGNTPDASTHHGDSGGGGVDADLGMITTVKNIRMNQPTNGTIVTLQNVVVVQQVTSSKYGHVWVQDQGGGMYSGIELFCNYGGSNPKCTTTRAQIKALTPGTVVTITGSFSSFLLSTAPAGAQPVLEIDNPTITSTGQTMTPMAVDVPAATIAKDQLAATGADPYKGAYVHVTGATSIPVSSVSPMEFSATCQDMSMPAMSGTTYGGFEATAGGATLAVSLNFYDTVTWCLPCTGTGSNFMPYPCAKPVTTTTTFTGVSGIVEPEYNSNGAVYLQVSPTTDSDLPM